MNKNIKHKNNKKMKKKFFIIKKRLILHPQININHLKEREKLYDYCTGKRR